MDVINAANNESYPRIINGNDTFRGIDGALGPIYERVEFLSE